jgi:hypothetical protein
MGLSDQLYTIKFTASEETNGVFLIGTAIVDINSGKSENLEAVASSSSSILSINTKATYRDFINKIQNVVYTGKQLKNITKNLQDHMKRSFANDGFLEELFHYVDTQDYPKLSYLIEQVIVKAAGVGSYTIQISTEKVSRQDLEKTTLPSSGEDPAASFDAAGNPIAQGNGTTSPVVSDIPPGSRVVKFKPILSPVSGTPVTELVQGTPIVARLVQGDPVTNDTIMSLNLRGEDGVIKGLPCTVHKITHRGNESDIIIKINDTLYGKYTEEENSVKIRTTTMDTSRAKSGKQNQNVDKNIEALKNDNSLFFYIMAIAALITLAIFVVVFFA